MRTRYHSQANASFCESEARVTDQIGAREAKNAPSLLLHKPYSTPLHNLGHLGISWLGITGHTDSARVCERYGHGAGISHESPLSDFYTLID